MGMLLLYAEHRSAVRDGQISLDEKDFFTEFGKRVFNAIMEIDKNAVFEPSLLGEFFTPEEQGRIMRLELSRRDLSDNGSSIFKESIAALKRETAYAGSDDPFEDIFSIIKDKKTNNA